MNNEKEFTPEERSAMCDSIDESQNGPDSTSKAVPLDAEQEAREWLKSQPSCVGYPGNCDGDLVGTEHERHCPMFGKKEPTTVQLLASYHIAKSSDHAAEIERLSKERDEARISLIVKRANEPCTCEDYMSFSCPRHGKASHEFMQIMTSGADEVEVSAIHPSILDALKDEHAKREAAESKLSQLQQQILKYENDEASCCPEDVGFVEFIGFLRKKIERMELSNEEKAKKIVERIWGDIARQNYKEFAELDSHVAAYVRNSWETFILAILNGGQQ